MYFIHHSLELPFVSSRNARDINGCEGDNNPPFLNLTTLKTRWYPKLRYNILFTTVPTPWSFYMGPHFTSNMEPLIYRGYYRTVWRYRISLECWIIFYNWLQQKSEIFFNTRREFLISKRPWNVLFYHTNTNKIPYHFTLINGVSLWKAQFIV